MHFLASRCLEMNPNDRIFPEEILLYLNKIRCYMRIFQYGPHKYPTAL